MGLFIFCVVKFSDKTLHLKWQKLTSPVRTLVKYEIKVIVISILSRNGLLKAWAWFIIVRSEIRKKQHAFKSVNFECRMVLFYTIWEKCRLFSIECRKNYLTLHWRCQVMLMNFTTQTIINRNKIDSWLNKICILCTM